MAKPIVPVAPVMAVEPIIAESVLVVATNFADPLKGVNLFECQKDFDKVYTQVGYSNIAGVPLLQYLDLKIEKANAKKGKEKVTAFFKDADGLYYPCTIESDQLLLNIVRVRVCKSDEEITDFFEKSFEDEKKRNKNATFITVKNSIKKKGHSYWLFKTVSVASENIFVPCVVQTSYGDGAVMAKVYPLIRELDSDLLDLETGLVNVFVAFYIKNGKAILKNINTVPDEGDVVIFSYHNGYDEFTYIGLIHEKGKHSTKVSGYALRGGGDPMFEGNSYVAVNNVELRNNADTKIEFANDREVANFHANFGNVLKDFDRGNIKAVNYRK